MKMQTDDRNLLRQYAEKHSQEAFAALVSRHVNLVYSAALRLVRSPQLAEEVSQSVFTDLARQAAQLAADTILTAWLYQVARRTAIDVIRHESRRQLREQVAYELTAMNATAADWTHVEPLLDEAMQALDDTDRAAVLLRFFENKSLRELGETLGTSEDAAQKRVSRAVERLREFFAKRGVAIGTGGLAVVISANAVQAAPAGLAAAISSAAAIAGTTATVTTTTTATITKAIVMTALQKTLITATIAVTVGAGVYEAHQASILRDQFQTLQQQQAPLTEQIRQSQQERDRARNRLATLANAIAKSKGDSAELLELRAEVARLRSEAAQSNDPFVQTALTWKAKQERLQKLFEDSLAKKVPEMQLLTDHQWLDIARDADLDTDSGVRKAMSRVRFVARNDFAPDMMSALKQYVEANDGSLPDDILQLKPYFKPPVDDAMLGQYKLLYSGKLSELPANAGSSIVTDQNLVDQDYDQHWHIGPNGYGPEGEITPKSDAIPVPELADAFKAFAAANNGQMPTDPNQLKPYLTTPAEEAALQKLIQMKPRE